LCVDMHCNLTSEVFNIIVAATILSLNGAEILQIIRYMINLQYYLSLNDDTYLTDLGA